MSGPSIRTFSVVDREAVGLEGGGDLVGVDRAVEVAFGVGVGLDRERPLGDLGGEVQQVGAAGFLELAEPLAVLLDDPQVVRGGEGGQALGEQVVAGEAGADLDEVAGLADVGDGVGQEDLHVAVLGAQSGGSCGARRRAGGAAGDRLARPVGLACAAGLGLRLGRGALALAFGLALAGFLSVILAMECAHFTS